MAELTESLFDDNDLMDTTHSHGLSGKVVPSSVGEVVVASRGQIRREIKPLQSAFAIDPEIPKSRCRLSPDIDARDQGLTMPRPFSKACFRMPHRLSGRGRKAFNA